MLLWVGFAVLTAAVVAALLRPLLASAHPEAASAGEGEGGSRVAASAVYRDQLAEIEAERARGHDRRCRSRAARVEISRRLLAASGTDAGVDGRRRLGAHLSRAAAMRSRWLMPMVDNRRLSRDRRARVQPASLAPVSRAWYGDAGVPNRRPGRGAAQRAIPRTAAAGMSSGPSICGSGATGCRECVSQCHPAARRNDTALAGLAEATCSRATASSQKRHDAHTRTCSTRAGSHRAEILAAAGERAGRPIRGRRTAIAPCCWRGAETAGLAPAVVERLARGGHEGSGWHRSPTPGKGAGVRPSEATVHVKGVASAHVDGAG